ncbi:hypothetical protein PF005_g26853 [Phytophthora fragariae]|uniref:Uncharacterized protein n=1 Tax=Phytophthora fragariae TaxID=53985 RepID=A0A6A3DPC3_9STRA|nr:hypothetical protein PF009_g27444 [Phytophthora fragariae]KAE8972077.1 hypothetical protein PF011_g25785 [Phytophthora fragariae]KAE9172132.1 hypothetical protein PF005_g26853 [Phytophthora fragariae]KAE9276142.1 hypothetical protein PF001_g26271 [Phytophthora fragariae]
MSRTCLAAFGGAPRAAALGRELRRAAAVLHARDHRRAGSSFVRCSFASKQSVYEISVSAPLSRLHACCQNVAKLHVARMCQMQTNKGTLLGRLTTVLRTANFAPRSQNLGMKENLMRVAPAL